MRVGINGFGRIGRQFLRIAWERPDVDVVHINDVADARTLAHLLKYDSTYGVWPHEVGGEGDMLSIDGHTIGFSTEKDPSRLPWKHSRVDVVLESSGKFRKREEGQAHLDAGARKVLISAPGKSRLDATIVLGVNSQDYDVNQHHVISIGSCTTNAFAPIAKVLHAEFGVEKGLMTTVHAFTTSQQLLDSPHKDLRRARGATQNIIPTSTGAAKSVGLVLPELAERIDALAMRVPVACGSIVDFNALLGRATTPRAINDAMRRWSSESMQTILRVADAPVVSSDVVGEPHSAVLSPDDTRVQNDTLVKVLAWYDNEWGFSNRLADMMERML